jgi:hypothetical protein
MEGIRKAMNGRNLKEGQWEDRKQWSLGVGQRRKNVLKHTHTHTHTHTHIYIYKRQEMAVLPDCVTKQQFQSTTLNLWKNRTKSQLITSLSALSAQQFAEASCPLTMRVCRAMGSGPNKEATM